MSLDISLITNNQKLYNILTTDYVANIIIKELRSLLCNTKFEAQDDLDNFICSTVINKHIPNYNTYEDIIKFNNAEFKKVYTEQDFNRLVDIKGINHVSYQIYNHYKDRMNISIRFLMNRVVESYFKYLYSEKIDRLKKREQNIWKLFSTEYGAYQTLPIKQLKRRPDPVFIYSMGDF